MIEIKFREEVEGLTPCCGPCGLVGRGTTRLHLTAPSTVCAFDMLIMKREILKRATEKEPFISPAVPDSKASCRVLCHSNFELPRPPQEQMKPFKVTFHKARGQAWNLLSPAAIVRWASVHRTGRSQHLKKNKPPSPQTQDVPSPGFSPICRVTSVSHGPHRPQAASGKA